MRTWVKYSSDQFRWRRIKTLTQQKHVRQIKNSRAVTEHLSRLKSRSETMSLTGGFKNTSRRGRDDRDVHCFTIRQEGLIWRSAAEMEMSSGEEEEIKLKTVKTHLKKPWWIQPPLKQVNQVCAGVPVRAGSPGEPSGNLFTFPQATEQRHYITIYVSSTVTTTDHTVSSQ